jgi:hypothetical protein
VSEWLFSAALATAAPALAYRPFIDPLNLHDAWWALLIPLSLGISIAYKAVRVRDMDTYWRQVIIMTIQIVVAMVLLAVASFLFVEVYLGWFGPD